MNPGEQTQVEFDRHEGAAYVGVVAIFREPEHDGWRTLRGLNTDYVRKRFSQSVKVSLKGNSVEIAD